jgi:hypothetical protein
MAVIFIERYSTAARRRGGPQISRFDHVQTAVIVGGIDVDTCDVVPNPEEIEDVS